MAKKETTADERPANGGGTADEKKAAQPEAAQPEGGEKDTVTCVIPNFDRFHREGPAGTQLQLYGRTFTIGENGDATTEVQPECVEAMVEAGRVITMEDHRHPLAPASEDEVKAANTKARTLKA